MNHRQIPLIMYVMACLGSNLKIFYTIEKQISHLLKVDIIDVLLSLIMAAPGETKCVFMNEDEEVSQQPQY